MGAWTVEKASRYRLALFLGLVTATFGFVQPFVPLYMSTAGLSRTQIGWVTGIGTALAVLVQPALGHLSDKLDSRRPFMCASAILAGIAFLSFPRANSPLTFCLLFAVGTNGTTYLQAAGGALAGRMISGPGGGSLYASLRVWGSVGYIVVSLASGLILNVYFPHALGRHEIDVLWRSGPMLFFGIAVLAWFLPDRKNYAGAEKNVRKPISGNLKRFLWAYFLYNLALYGATSYLSIYLKSLGASGLWITGTFAAGVVIEVLVMRQSGAFSDRFGRRPALALSFALLPVRMLLYAPATGPAWVMAVQSLHGINFGIVGAVAVAFANDLAGEGTHGRAQARLFAVAGLASAFGPVVLGRASDVIGLRLMYVVAAAFAAVAAGILILTVEDSNTGSQCLTDKLPKAIRPAFRWLDRPPSRRANRPA